jgi:hypothetical protein
MHCSSPKDIILEEVFIASPANNQLNKKLIWEKAGKNKILLMHLLLCYAGFVRCMLHILKIINYIEGS